VQQGCQISIQLLYCAKVDIKLIFGTIKTGFNSDLLTIGIKTKEQNQIAKKLE
jgi:hypothetical protein